ncbi:Hypothetical predicted protein [Cloeon dipterum]|uniref:START domain-containing protein 10 n=1 Tax=Cloeon dipterum TaxID=197152 RepID=A0A8S1C2V9_9INSE|nr:Hypothetical predicted protein [Cloeon dipterum]
MMELGLIKIAEDSDFQHFRRIIDNHDDWELNYARDDTKVWTKCVPGIDFKMVKLVTVFDDVSPNVMYDVLHDPEYRRVWDKHMIEAHDIGYLNPNNDIGYYAMSCPVPLKNRDFVLQRSWLDMGTEQIIMNHSVNHKDYSEKPNYVRGISYITGYLIRPKGNSGCFVGYASQTDPKGTLPSWMKASQGYPAWKANNNPAFKPWFFPEQITVPRITAEDCGAVLQRRRLEQH